MGHDTVAAWPVRSWDCPGVRSAQVFMWVLEAHTRVPVLARAPTVCSLLPHALSGDDTVLGY